ncbi:MAG: putative sugar O-methyltransferase [Candidatus Babeliales bacterium]|nr:putative sugar O-methyltransferase [Candidatus Babeliales bacterium]
MLRAKYIKLIVLLALILNKQSYGQSFESIWYEMQYNYNQLKSKFLDNADSQKYLTQHWKIAANEIENLLQGPPNINFLSNYYVGQNMVRNDFNRTQKFEECFLEHCVSQKSKEIIKKFKDNDNNLLTKPSKFNLSVNTLGHLFYATKVLENVKTDPKRIIEFGGGYGNLAHVFKQIYPQSSILIFDIPASIALQYLFLKYTNHNAKIIILDEPVSDLQAGTIYLVPINLLEEFNIKADVFISTFAITESSQYIQNLAVKKKFFDANLIYIAGQLNGWKESGHAWMTEHTQLIDNIRLNYKTVNCSPFHHFEEKLMSYELIGSK